jgi:hypothetical protein
MPVPKHTDASPFSICVILCSSASTVGLIWRA